MKRTLTFLLAISLCLTSAAQIHPHFTKGKNYHVKSVFTRPIPDNIRIGTRQPNETVLSKSVLSDASTMQTFYDTQSNRSTSEKVYMYPDGTIGVCGTMAHDTNFTDRGTGYNFFNGTEWGPAPAARTESVRTGWPCIAPCGTGEITVAHRGGYGLVFMKRATRGTGTWTESVIEPPAGVAGLFYPRMVTSGVNRETVHVICNTADTIAGGTIYNGLDGALIYNRSLDGGLSWEGWRQLDGLTSANYKNFDNDANVFAEPKGDTIAFVYGGEWQDLGYLKSTDNGATWTRSLVWENPWVLYNGPFPTEEFYTTDGNVAAALDKNGNLHIVAGLSRTSKESNMGIIPYLWADGLLYWNETMPKWNTVLDPDTLYTNGNIIGWVQDTTVFNADSTALAFYGSGMSSQPSMVIDDLNRIFVVWSGVTNNRDKENHLYRRIFARVSTTGGSTWGDTIVPLTDGPEYEFTEAVYSSISPNSNDNLQIVIETDSLAGTYAWTLVGHPSQPNFTTNDITFLNPTKASILYPHTGIEEKQVHVLTARLCPNPVKDQGNLNLFLQEGGNLTLEVTNIFGQKVMSADKGFFDIGNHQVTVDVHGLQSGLYFYTLHLNGQEYTGKMVVNR